MSPLSDLLDGVRTALDGSGPEGREGHEGRRNRRREEGGEGGVPGWFDEVAWFRASPPDPVAREDADHVADGRDSFVEAVRSAGEGETVWVADDVRLTGWAGLDPAPGVTVAGDRDVPNGRRGPRVSVEDTDHTHVVESRHDGLRFTGLRLDGPTHDRTEYDERKKRTFAHLMGEDCRVDNCELSGWPFAAIASGSKRHAPSHRFDHNHVHDCRMEGLGYGFELYDGVHEFAYNYFDRCRHAIAGFGHDANGYHAHHNVVGPSPTSHAFDMHALEENVSHDGDPALAGADVVVDRNAFLFTHDCDGRAQEAVRFRGVPAGEYRVTDNWFAHDAAPAPPGESGDAFRQDRTGGGFERLTATGNRYGTRLSFDVPALVADGD